MRQAAGVVADARRELRILGQRCDIAPETRVSRLHQLRDVDPAGVILHLHRLVELERLRFQVELQPGERLDVSVEEARRSTADHAVERRHALLTVEQQLHDSRGKRTVAAMIRGLGLGRPDQQPADRMAAVERIEQAADLVAVPNVAALKLGEGHVPAVDMVENR